MISMKAGQVCHRLPRLYLVRELPMDSEDGLQRVTDENYNDYLAAPAALILFKIANCEKCEEFEPIIAEAAKQHEGRIRFGKALLHVPGACREIKRKYRFDSFPTTHFYKAGELVFQVDRKLSHEELAATIRKYLLSFE
jgi:thioredoxin-like negative regulator of GroEL